MWVTPIEPYRMNIIVTQSSPYPKKLGPNLTHAFYSQTKFIFHINPP